MLRRRVVRERLAQAGLSIVELLVGVAIGLVVVAAAALMVSGQLFENRRLVIEAQLQQDLRATADIITRDLRRVGALPEETLGAFAPGILETVFGDGTGVINQVSRNPHFLGAGSSKIFAVTGSTQVIVPYTTSDVRATDMVVNPYGFRLSGNVIQSRLPGNAAVWQDLTDPRVMRVTRLSISQGGPPSVSAEVVPCPSLCLPGNDTSCWPRVRVHDVTVQIEAEATADSSIRRAVSSRVRLRNEQIVTQTLAAAPFYQVCPP
jgi:type II secretory pathway component PulJ